MPDKSRLEKPADKQNVRHMEQDSISSDTLQSSMNTTVHPVKRDAQSPSTQEVLRLQRTIGNRAVTHLLTNKAPMISRHGVTPTTLQRETQVQEVTPEEEAFNQEHAAQKGLNEEQAGATAVNNLGAPGPVCTAALQPNYWGYTIPEAIVPTLTATLAAGTWTAAATTLTGNYSIATRLLPGVTEVTGPGGNTTQANYNAQVVALRALSRNWGSWFMLQAIVNHEAVHATKMAPSLSDSEVAINALFAALTVPDGGAVNSAATAVTAIQATPAYATAVANAYNLWKARYFVLIANDHNGVAGPSYDAERSVVNPMIAQINAHATAPAQNWGPAA